MGFGSSRLLKSFGGFGRDKGVADAPAPAAPSDMSERLARVRQSALAAEAQPRFAQDTQYDPHAGANGASAEPYSPLEQHEHSHKPIGLDLRALALEPMETPHADTHQSDAVAWLATQTPAVWHYVACNWDWDWGVEPLMWIAQQPECDAGTAASLFWKSGEAEDYLPFGDAEPTEDYDILVADMAEFIASRFEREDYGPTQFAFDERLVLPHFPSRLEKLYMEERMEWDAHKVPRRASGEMVFIDRFDHETEADIKAFLAAMKDAE